MNELATSEQDRRIDSGGFTAWDRLLRNRLIARLAALRYGRLVIADACGTVDLGDAIAVAGVRSSLGGARADIAAGRPETAAVATVGLDVKVEVSSPQFYRAVAANGSVGAGEAYMDGHWRCNDLVALVRLLVRNRDLLDDMESGFARLAGFAMRAWHSFRSNTRAGSRRNIAAHYDLGNEFFELFLSPDLMYSSALWAGENDTLSAASTRKLDRICTSLELKPGDRVVEIGTGWGGFALHAARHYGCHVTTTTISGEQHRLASERVAAAGLADRVTVLLQDYRDLEGRYDKLVSIEMIEAIGAPYLETYFGKLGQLLEPGGLALLQAITIEDHRYEQALRAVDFIKRHVFPGSFIPSIHAMLTAKTRASDLALIRLDDFGASYARTLRAWRTSFLSRLPQVRAQGFDDRFIRMWEFYLAYCEGGFEERSIGVAHLLLAKPGCGPQRLEIGPARADLE